MNFIHIYKGLDAAQSHWGGQSTESADSKANLNGKHLHRRAQKQHFI